MENDMTGQAKFVLTTPDFTINLEGSESFVSKQVENIDHLIRDLKTSISPKKKPDVEKNTIAEVNGTGGETSNNLLEKYPRVYAILNEQLKILPKAPGNNNKTKTANLVLLFAYYQLKSGAETVDTANIRPYCEHQNCLDKANFAAAFKGNSNFISDGKRGGKTTVKLSHDGIAAAEKLLEVLSKEGA